MIILRITCAVLSARMFVPLIVDKLQPGYMTGLELFIFFLRLPVTLNYVGR